jgi:hypothetical protein
MLQKDIPLIYLHNYALTFDSMVKELTMQYDNRNLYDLERLKTSDELYTALLIIPYDPIALNTARNLNINNNNFVNAYAALSRGQSSLGFGRLKFISDQLFNKVLIQSLYSDILANVDNEYDIPSQANHGTALLNRKHIDSNHLFYPDNQNGGKWKKIETSNLLNVIGFARINLVIVRHLQFLTLLQHVILYKLGKELEQHDGYVINSYSTIDPTITEFRGQQMWNKNSYKMSPYDNNNNIYY